MCWGWGGGSQQPAGTGARKPGPVPSAAGPSLSSLPQPAHHTAQWLVPACGLPPKCPGLPPAQTCPGNSWGPSFSCPLSHLRCSSPSLSSALLPPGQPHPLPCCCLQSPVFMGYSGGPPSLPLAPAVGPTAPRSAAFAPARVGRATLGHLLQPPDGAHSCQALGQCRAGPRGAESQGAGQGLLSRPLWQRVCARAQKPQVLLRLKFEAFWGSLCSPQQPVRRYRGEARGTLFPARRALALHPTHRCDSSQTQASVMSPCEGETEARSAPAPLVTQLISGPRVDQCTEGWEPEAWWHGGAGRGVCTRGHGRAGVLLAEGWAAGSPARLGSQSWVRATLSKVSGGFSELTELQVPWKNREMRRTIRFLGGNNQGTGLLFPAPRDKPLSL